MGTTAETIKRKANEGTSNQIDYERKAIRLSSHQSGLIHWDDRYSAGWGDGHRFLFGDYSWLVIDGRGVIAGQDEIVRDRWGVAHYS